MMKRLFVFFSSMRHVSFVACLASSAFMMSLALCAALLTNAADIFPETLFPPARRSFLTILLLAVMLTLSLSRVPARDLAPWRYKGSLLRSLGMGLLIPSFLPLAGFLLLRDTPYAIYAAGLVFIAATPFAASVAPLSFILRGDMARAARATIYVYLAALVWIPLVVYGFLGAWVDMGQLVKIVLVIIGLPLVLSRALTRLVIAPRKMAVFLNCAIFFLVWLSVATADFRHVAPGIVAFFLAVVALRTFGLGLVVNGLEKKAGVAWGERVTDILMASYKNKGIAIALCVATLNEGAASAMVAIATSIVLEVCWVIYMDSVLFAARPGAPLGHQELGRSVP